MTIEFLPEHGYTMESLEIRSPDPPVGGANITPEQLVAPELDKLASDLQITKKFKPEKQTRDARPLERGYWSIICADWGDDIKRVAWKFLANYVGIGVAGWGIWCTRDEQFEWLRVYCWGHTIPYIYYLLYLASCREILFTGASWIDGNGETIVVMGKRDRKVLQTG